MHDKHPSSKKSVDLDSLLKLKRFEQPDAAFWEKFDEQLHQKTLKALMRKGSLRKRIAQRVIAWLHPALAMPAAAAAAAVFALYVAPLQTLTHHPSNNDYSESALAQNAPLAIPPTNQEVSSFDTPVISKDEIHFVVDAISTGSATEQDFEEAWADKTMTLSNSDIYYADTTLRSGNTLTYTHLVGGIIH